MALARTFSPRDLLAVGLHPRREFLYAQEKRGKRNGKRPSGGAGQHATLHVNAFQATTFHFLADRSVGTRTLADAVHL